MRYILTALLLAAAPNTASALCSCSCINNQAVPICTSAGDTPPICQQICLPVLGQAISTQSVGTPIPYQNLTAPPTASGATPIDPAVAAVTAAATAAAGAGTRIGVGSVGNAVSGAGAAGASVGAAAAAAGIR